jgi:type VI secretion system protein ImpM
MGFGLFGKLPQKRDFITFGIPGEILAPLETWLQTAVAASRSELGRSWEEIYLVAPIWRFWIGSDVFGANFAGVLMPSVDGVGRFFPLLAMYACENGETMPPPSYAPQEKWFGAIEARLLGVLDEGATPTVDTLLAGLPTPAMDSLAPNAHRSDFKGGPVWMAGQDTDTPSFLASIFEDDYREVARARSYWWVPGTDERGPVLHAKNGLPDPYFHARMLRVVAD